MAFQIDYKSVPQAGEITLRRGSDGKLHAETVSDAAWCRLLCRKTSFAAGEIDRLLWRAGDYGLGLLYLENEVS